MSGDMGIPGGGKRQTGAQPIVHEGGAQVRPNDFEQAAVRGAKALMKMTELDRDEVMKQMPGRVADIAGAIAGGPLDNHLLRRKASTLARMIEAGQNAVSSETTAAGDRVAELRTAMTSGEGPVRIIRETAAALAKIAASAGATPEQFEQLAARLELLAALNGEKKLAMISDRALKGKIAQLTNGNLQELAGAVGKELAQLAYGPVRRAAVSENLV